MKTGGDEVVTTAQGVARDGSPRGEEADLFGDAGDRPDGVGVGLHDHDEGELSWVDAGVQRAVTREGVWVLPPTHAIWIPSGVEHDGSKCGRGSFFWLKFGEGVTAKMPARCSVLEATPGLVGAMRTLVELGETTTSGARGASLGELFVSSTRCVALEPVRLPLITSEVFEPILARLRAFPADDRPVDEWARFLRMSESTFYRSFRAKMGLSFADYRLRVRMLAALEELAAGREVARASAQAGYRSVSMFVQTFRQLLGTTPGRYFASVKEGK